MGLVPLITLCTWVWVYRFTHLWYHLPPLTGFCSGTPPLPPPPLIHTHYTRSPLVVVRAGTCIWLLVGVGRGEGVDFLGLRLNDLGLKAHLYNEYSYLFCGFIAGHVLITLLDLLILLAHKLYRVCY